MLPRCHVEFRDAPGYRRINVRLHLHGFQCQKFSTPLDGMVNLHRDSADEAGGWSAHLTGIFGVGLGMAALNDAQRAVAHGDFPRLAVEFEEKRARAISVRFADGKKFHDHRLARLNLDRNLFAWLQSIEKSSLRQHPPLPAD